MCFQEEKEIGTAMQSFSLPVIAVMVAKFNLCLFLREFTDKLAKVNHKVGNQSLVESQFSPLFAFSFVK